MREIEFKGKRIEDGKWIYGYYWYVEEHYANHIENKLHFIKSKNNGIDYGIDIETLGQYTGLTDKNGTKIFEGDIVEFETNVNCITSELKPYWKDCYEKQYALGNGTWWVRKDQAIVQWNSKDGMWDLKVYNNGRYKRKSKLFTYRESDYVVVGNIHDNPELLGGSDESICD